MRDSPGIVPPEKYRRSPDWWDAFYLPSDVPKAHHATWLDEHLPPLHQHDYALYTDGSGCLKGWGAACALVEEVQAEGSGLTGWRDVVVSAHYGQTVNRCELTAFIDGVAAIVTRHIRRLQDSAEEGTPKVGLSSLIGDARPTILWHTDRKSLAQCLLFNEDNISYGSRRSDSDLWMRYSTFARHVCISPRHAGRNVVPLQAATDAVCTIARHSLKSSRLGISALLAISKFHQTPLSCQNTRSQQAVF